MAVSSHGDSALLQLQTDEHLQKKGIQVHRVDVVCSAVQDSGVLSSVLILRVCDLEERCASLAAAGICGIYLASSAIAVTWTRSGHSIPLSACFKVKRLLRGLRTT
jgi:hypothetical protein